METIDTLETVTTKKGTYEVHTDCYKQIKKDSADKLELRIHEFREEQKTNYIRYTTILAFIVESDKEK